MERELTIERTPAVPPSLIPFGVIAEVSGVEPELLGNERTQLSGRLFAFPEDVRHLQ
jgi:hypothetical protein